MISWHADLRSENIARVCLDTGMAMRGLDDGHCVLFRRDRCSRDHMYMLNNMPGNVKDWQDAP